MAVPRDPTAGYLDDLRRWADAHGRSAAGLVADLAVAIGRREGWPAAAWSHLPAEPGPVAPPQPPPAVVAPDLLGQAYEAALARARRRVGGVFFTPAAVADRLVALALGGCAALRRRRAGVGDPAVGGGAFLLAAARYLAARPPGPGWEPAALVTYRLWGADVDPAAVAVARLALAWWAWRQQPDDGWQVAAGRRVVVADALLDDAAWPSGVEGLEGTEGVEGVGRADAVAAVVGNPPFLSQLSRATTRNPEAARRLVERYDAAARGYVDSAGLFLLAACRRAAPGGRVLLIQPEPFLVTAHATAARRDVLRHGRLLGLWLGGPHVFRASVRVCAPLVEIGGPSSHWSHSSCCSSFSSSSGEGTATVAVWTGPDVRRGADVRVRGSTLAASPTWGPLSAGARGVPSVRFDAEGTVGDLARATAGFRDQFYGLAPFVVEAGALAHPTRPRCGAERVGDRGERWSPLVTSGVVGPAWCSWGRRPVRFAGRSWRAPVVDIERLGQVPALARWVGARLRPKLLVATQSPIVEATPDPEGRLVPSVPVVAVEPHDAASLWLLLAVLVAPPATAWALGHYGGAGLSGDAVKLSARQVLAVPLPPGRDGWQRGAEACRSAFVASESADEAGWRSALLSAARHMIGAYGIDEGGGAELLSWWADRLPRWPPVRRSSTAPI